MDSTGKDLLRRAEAAALSSGADLFSVDIIGLSQTGPGGLSQSTWAVAHISQTNGMLISHKHLIQRLSQTKLLMLYHKLFLFEAFTKRNLLHLTTLKRH